VTNLEEALDIIDQMLGRDPDFGSRNGDDEIRERLDALRERALKIKQLQSVRYTPFLDKYKIVVAEGVPDHAVNIIDSCLSAIEALTNWGEYEGKKRKPCPGQPILLAGMPIGMYHCEGCRMMVVAGMPHPEPGAPPESEQDPDYPMSDYEVEYGRPWPAGYIEEDEPQ
jgi:hypothetical protein